MRGRAGRWLRAAWREAGARRMPHGLIHPLRYLQPSPTALVRLHRQLWWHGLPGCPRTLWLLLETCLWLRWVLFEAWLASARALARHGRIVRDREAIGLLRQARRVLGLALCWSIPPAQAYQFGLYRAAAAGPGGDEALAYVYGTESMAWHRKVQGDDAAAAAAEAALRDKDRFASAMAAEGLPTVPCVALWRPGQNPSLRHWLEALGAWPSLAPPGLFFKSRDGHGALDAFAAWLHQGDWQARCIDGRQAAGEREVQALWQSLCARGPVLVQPRLLNSPAVAALAAGDEVVTLRVITRRDPGGRVQVEMALLEVPLGVHGRHQVWPVRPADGWVLPAPAPLTDLPAAAPRLPDQGLRLPGWEVIASHSCAAHRHLAALRHIAWDWAITDDGGRLLEGNAHWALAPPQRLFGPLAASALRSA